jgi:hypothetical protein
MGRLGENIVPCQTLDRTFRLRAVRLLRGFEGEPHFSTRPPILLTNS